MTEYRDEKAGDCFSDGRIRCAWITPKSDQSFIAFHDKEWGVHVHDDKNTNTPPDLKTFAVDQVKHMHRVALPNLLASHRRRHLGTSSGKHRVLSLPAPKTNRDERSVQKNVQINTVSQKTINAHEAKAAVEHAVSKVEAAMTVAEEAAKEADAAEAARASKTLKGKKASAKW
ncbi:hypothetical protein F2Q68_00009833 [Brassica cretica]|uniref:Uncharacterized protein n=1 Tax=Brassica cretica TaxID=69181 RepID=A0A8S9KS91_BRACR|nr:hypothetical protein F2Q68_00009833 [Brassica cretica]